MPSLTGAFFQSLDGVIQGPGAPMEDTSGGFRYGGWAAPYWDESLEEPVGRILEEAEYDLLLARRTYDIFAAYWPYNVDIPIGAKFERINKYVLTHSDEPLEWANSRKFCGDTAETVAEILEDADRDLLIQGSSSLYAPLLAAGLVDRLVVMTFPVLLGKGKRIFDGSLEPGALELVDQFVSDKGVMVATYKPGGEVRAGSFETREPSQAELERRRQLAREEA